MVVSISENKWVVIGPASKPDISPETVFNGIGFVIFFVFFYFVTCCCLMLCDLAHYVATEAHLH